MRITLTVTAGPHQGREFTFVGHDTFLVGRSERAHFRLPARDRYFSRAHFLVEVNPPQCRLLDLGSRNGTHVNGRRVEVADLRHGDQIKAGRTVLSVAIEEVTAADLVPPDPAPAEVRTAAVPPMPTPATVPVATPAEGPCPACQALVTTTDLASGNPLVAGVPPLCRACQDQVLGRPQPIAGYLLIRPLGRGGMGVVFLARRTADGAIVAVKIIRPTLAGSQADVARFLREANILRELDHPNIVAFRDMGEAEEQLYFAMDYVRGIDAGRLLKEVGPLPVGRAVRLVGQLLEALEYAHARGFVHRDIKPANLMVAGDGDGEVAKLADFGLARAYQSSKLSGLTMTGNLGGTVAYMAPEQILHFREAKPPVDQYAAAATVYKLLTAEYVYDFPPHLHQQIALVLQQPPVPIRARRPDLPEALAQVVHRALARDPAKRFADVKTMRKALTRFGA